MTRPTLAGHCGHWNWCNHWGGGLPWLPPVIWVCVAAYDGQEVGVEGLPEVGYLEARVGETNGSSSSSGRSCSCIGSASRSSSWQGSKDWLEEQGMFQVEGARGFLEKTETLLSNAELAVPDSRKTLDGQSAEIMGDYVWLLLLIGVCVAA